MMVSRGCLPGSYQTIRENCSNHITLIQCAVWTCVIMNDFLEFFDNIYMYTYMSQRDRPGPEVIKLFSCSTQLSMKFFLLINVKMPTFVGILTFMSRKNSILGLSESEKR